MHKYHHMQKMLSTLLSCLFLLLDFNISLVGPARCYGRVEVYNSTSRGKLCDDSWVLNDAIVVCRELKCGKALAISQSVSFNSSKEEMWLADVNCSGRETSLMQCPHGKFGENGCERNKGVVVVCSGDLHLHFRARPIELYKSIHFDAAMPL